MFRCVSEDIYKLDIPCGYGFTSVFALKYGNEWLVIDSGMSDNDVENFIIPAATELGVTPKWLICSHLHDDHYGGFKRLSEYYKKAKVASFGEKEIPGVKNKHRISNGELFIGRYKAISLKGHTDDGIGILDTKENILLSFDCMQFFGIGSNGVNLIDINEYLITLQKVSDMKLHGIIASHSYDLYGAEAFGKVEVSNYINGCYNAVNCILNTIHTCVDIGGMEIKTRDKIEKIAEKIVEKYNNDNKNLPPASIWTFTNIILNLLQTN